MGQKKRCSTVSVGVDTILELHGTLGADERLPRERCKLSGSRSSPEVGAYEAVSVYDLYLDHILLGFTGTIPILVAEPTHIDRHAVFGE